MEPVHQQGIPSRRRVAAIERVGGSSTCLFSRKGISATDRDFRLLTAAALHLSRLHPIQRHRPRGIHQRQPMPQLCVPSALPEYPLAITRRSGWR